MELKRLCSRRQKRLVFQFAWILILVSAPLSNLAQRVEPKGLDDATREACAQWLERTGMPPENYVVSKFSKYDLVMLGETHEVKENCEFVAALVPLLYRAGVRTLCSEFVVSRHNERLATIVTAGEYDETAVKELFRTGPWPTWGYKEYMDIVRAVWTLNRGLPSGADPFRIVGIDSDWRQIDILTKGAAERMKIVLAREAHMVNTIAREVFEKRTKALLHIGFAHTARQGKRVAASLAKNHGNQLYQICMHHDMPGAGAPGRLTRFIEEVVTGAKAERVGFDVAGTPLASLRDDQGQYFQMLGKQSTFKDFAEGYVYLGSTSQLKPVTWAKGFITPNTFEEARTVAERLRWIKQGQCTTPEQLEAALAARLTKRQNTPPPKPRT